MGITRCLPRKGAFEIARHYVNGGEQGLHGVKAGPEVVPFGGFRPLYLARHHQYVPHYAHAGPVYLRLRRGGGGWRALRFAYGRLRLGIQAIRQGRAYGAARHEKQRQHEEYQPFHPLTATTLSIPQISFIISAFGNIAATSAACPAPTSMSSAPPGFRWAA